MQTEREILTGGARTASGWTQYRKDETGSFTIFGLFIFLMIIMVAGLAVDMMRYEHDRVGVQNTLDTAIVAATRLNQDADTNEEVEALVKDYFRVAGYDPDIVDVVPNIEGAAGGEETLRTVEARVNFSMNTAFMNMLGIDELDGVVGGGAREGQQIIEVAMVLDISGSMGSGQKLQNMKDAAKQFVSIVLNNNGPERVMISIIPYNMQVQMSADLQSRLDIANTMVIVDPVPTHPGAIDQFITHNSAARCARFVDADFDSRRLAASGDLEPSGKFATGNWSYNTPGGGNVDSNAYWCGSGYPEMMLFQNDEQKLHDHIDSLSARGMTAIDYGMKWATGILDPSFRPIVQGMLTDSNTARANAQQASADNGTPYVPPNDDWIVPPNVAGHPVDLGTPNVYKYIVLMTDGANTQHLDLKDEYKSGPTRVWWSETLANGNEFNGFVVEMPENSASQRWYRPRSPGTTSDDQYLSETDMDPSGTYGDAEQWSYHQLYERFSVNNAADYFFRTDPAARTAHRNAIEDTGGYGTADVNLERICSQASENEWMTIYAVAFEAPTGGQQAMQDCIGSSQGRYFAVQGQQLIAAFNEIAAEITQLRLTQ
jgi:Flp pilus assembly protein TadG